MPSGRAKHCIRIGPGSCKGFHESSGTKSGDRGTAPKCNRIYLIIRLRRPKLQGPLVWKAALALRADRVVGSCFYCVWTMRKNFFGSLETQMPNGTVLVAPVTSPLP